MSEINSDQIRQADKEIARCNIRDIMEQLNLDSLKSLQGFARGLRKAEKINGGANV